VRSAAALIVMAVAGWAGADETLPGDAGSPRVLFALDGALLVPLACVGPRGTLEGDSACARLVSLGATVLLPDGQRARIVEATRIGCAGEVDPVPAFRLDRADTGQHLALVGAEPWRLGLADGRDYERAAQLLGRRRLPRDVEVFRFDLDGRHQGIVTIRWRRGPRASWRAWLVDPPRMLGGWGCVD
jgi:hypothetical protein